jgi:hypothetical protein
MGALVQSLLISRRRRKMMSEHERKLLLAMNSLHYRIEQNPEGRWLIINALDESMAWSSTHRNWHDRQDRTACLISFADHQAAKMWGMSCFSTSPEP